MKLFWKLFCSMVSITVLACAVGGFVLIDGQFRTAFGQEVQALYEENDMLRYSLSREAERQALTSREDLSRLAGNIAITAGGRTVAFRLSDADGTALYYNGGLFFLDAGSLISGLGPNQRGWQLRQGAGHSSSTGPAPSPCWGRRCGWKIAGTYPPCLPNATLNITASST